MFVCLQKQCRFFVSVCTGHFIMVPLNLTYLHCLQHPSLNISSIYVTFYIQSTIVTFKFLNSQQSLWEMVFDNIIFVFRLCENELAFKYHLIWDLWMPLKELRLWPHQPHRPHRRWRPLRHVFSVALNVFTTTVSLYQST